MGLFGKKDANNENYEGELLEMLVDNHYKSKNGESFAALLGYLREAEVCVPMSMALSKEEAEKLKAAGGSIKDAKIEKLRMSPNLLESGDGELFFPVFSSKNQASDDYAKKFAWAKMPFIECCSFVTRHSKCKKIVINPFTKNLVVSEPVVETLLKSVVQKNVIKETTDLIVAQPGKEADALRDKALEFLSEQSKVSTCWLAHLITADKDSYILVVECDIAPDRLDGFFRTFHTAVRDSAPAGHELGFMKYPSLKDRLEKAGIKPFFIKI